MIHISKYGRFPKFHRVFVGPRPWHIEIRHRVKQISTINLFGFETQIDNSKIEIMETDRDKYYIWLVLVYNRTSIYNSIMVLVYISIAVLVYTVYTIRRLRLWKATVNICGRPGEGHPGEIPVKLYWNSVNYDNEFEQNLKFRRDSGKSVLKHRKPTTTKT